MKKLCMAVVLLLTVVMFCGCMVEKDNPLLTQNRVVEELEKTKQVRDEGRDMWYDLRFRYQNKNYDVIATRELLDIFAATAWEETENSVPDGEKAIRVSLFDGYIVKVHPEGSVTVSDEYAASDEKNIQCFMASEEFYDVLLAYITENRQPIPET